MKIPVSLLKNPVHLLSVGFGSGLAPKAPGTFGTIAALPFWYVLQFLPPAYYVVVLILAFILGVYLCGATADALGVHDHGGIVWDEFVGYWITMFMAPAGWFWVLLGFGLFRLLDIVKPWPISWVDKELKGGLGIMLDDVLAGIMAALCIQAIAVFSI